MKGALTVLLILAALVLPSAWAQKISDLRPASTPAGVATVPFWQVPNYIPNNTQAYLPTYAQGFEPSGGTGQPSIGKYSSNWPPTGTQTEPRAEPPACASQSSGSNDLELLGRSLKITGLAILVLSFGSFVILLEFVVMILRKQSWSIVTTRVFGLTLVITVGLLLITAGYDNTQIAPMMGLLGTIVGYLLGKGDTSDTQPRPANNRGTGAGRIRRR
ncbi:membrane hypothetical protein [Paraburkholderia tropica]|uniref:hypothetical protein n=1 Tax=Paraburkholderia tropica TaxID=92647 RepID=UPI001CB30FA8|nr:hypothetical protein [Paraburkholderia tropica]CAG9201844.1 membrane hypothetical protein [Paraburkholderia tropica]